MTLRTSGLEDFGWSPFFQSQVSPAEWAGLEPARVVAVHRGRLELQAPGLALDIPCGELVAAVGDWLLLDAGHRPHRLLERRSLFKRVAAGTSHAIQLIAANVDTAFVVTSCNLDFNLARLERYVALACEAGAVPVIVITKADLADGREYVRAASRVRAGIHVEALNALDASQVELLSAWCARGQTVALLGSSGVGKSTIAGMLTGEALSTQPVRAHDDRGRHTTTRRELFRMRAGGLLLDTPGMRELQLVDVDAGLAEVFADIEAAAAQCRFADCRHLSEPGCAVLAGVQGGTVDADRLQRWRKLVAENARNRQTLAEKRAGERRFGRHARQAMAAKRARRDGS